MKFFIIIIIIIIQIHLIQVAFSKNTINILLSSGGKNPYHIDSPSSSKTFIESVVLGNLIKVDNSLILPKLLKDLYYDYQTNEYVLVLRDDLYFHNKRKVKVEDLEFSLLRHYFSHGKSHAVGALDNIVGINEIRKKNIKKFKSGLVEGVRIVSHNTLRVKLFNQDSNFLYMISNPSFSLVPIEALDSSYLNWKTTPIGTGNYAVEKGFENGKVKLVKVNPKTNNGIDEIYLHTIISDNIEYDISLLKLPEKNLKNYSVYFSRYPINQFGLIFTNNNELGTNLNFRKFVQSALDSEKFLRYEDGFLSVYSKLNWRINETASPYSPENAIKYFNKIPKHLREKEWEVTIFSSGNTIDGYKKNFTEEIKKQLGIFGFKIKFVPVSSQFLGKNIAKKTPFDVSLFHIDPFDIIFKYSRLTDNGCDKYVKPLPDVKLENLYHSALRESNLRIKYEKISELDKYIQDKAYWVPLLYRKSTYFYNLNTIKQITVKGNEITFLDIDDILLK